MATKVTIKSVTEKYEKDIARYQQELQALQGELAHITAQLHQSEKDHATLARERLDHAERIQGQQRLLDDTNALLAKTQDRANQQSIWWYIFGVLTGFGLAALLYKLGVVSQHWF